MEPPRGCLLHLWNFICFLPYFIGFLLVAFLKGAIVAPIVCVIMTIGNSAIGEDDKKSRWWRRSVCLEVAGLTAGGGSGRRWELGRRWWPGWSLSRVWVDGVDW
ncbi:hypothetical protein L1987_59693 [Smallanthus sonchifolius]|uniref:Uncharacterized protein n=1 Tax=Smallanthus sonchifolius TaxID=185202 RepID=A0ACB9D5Y7_9ASTR|nr:hypothetical protein L1987_59693 [Smallanthus sonchifolius]